MSNLLDTPKLGFWLHAFAPLLTPKDQKSIDIEQLEEDGRCVHKGWRHVLDTAAYVYHEGESELLCARRWWRYTRDSFTIATKCLALGSAYRRRR